MAEFAVLTDVRSEFFRFLRRKVELQVFRAYGSYGAGWSFGTEIILEKIMRVEMILNGRKLGVSYRITQNVDSREHHARNSKLGAFAYSYGLKQ